MLQQQREILAEELTIQKRIDAPRWSGAATYLALHPRSHIGSSRPRARTTAPFSSAVSTPQTYPPKRAGRGRLGVPSRDARSP